MPRKKLITSLSEEREEQRERALADLTYYINLIQPKRYLGNIHREVINWWTSEDSSSHQLLLLPRDHMKSALLAFWCTWMLTKDPTQRILYISSTSNLAIKQLKFMKDILTSDTYRLFWPEMVEKEEAKREKWTEREISIDHPLRKDWSIRDPSIFTAGLTTNIVGMHCGITALDDVVVATNAYTAEGREKAKDQYSFLSSIADIDGISKIVGTRYHPHDLYNDLISMQLEEYDELGKIKKVQPLFDVMQREVESIGDGTGEFLWPRSQGPEGKHFGFDIPTLATKKSQYLNKLHFRAQYYNDPHDVDSSPIKRELFQYYDQNYLSRRDGRWFFKKERINVCASIDFAYSLGRKADFTSIVVLGVDGNHNYFVLEIDRFKTDKPSEYFSHLLKLYEKWGFLKLRAEVSVAQIVIVKELKELVRRHGLSMSIEEYRPTRWLGSKEERIMATLEPKYANLSIWHYPGGNCQLLEEELMFANPAHDDIKDALASAVDFAVPPSNFYAQKKEKSAFDFHSRWGGVV